MKTCGRCATDKPLTAFKPKKGYSQGVYCWCRACENTYNAERRKKDPEKHREVDRRSYRKHASKRRQKSRGERFRQKYWPGLTSKEDLEMWDNMYTAQGRKCAACRESKPLDVDHCHKTGKVRGLLCNDCNTAIARIYDNELKALAIAAYLREHADASNKSRR